MNSIYETIKAAIDADTIFSEPPTLPDAGDIQLRDGERWVPGAYEATVLRSDFRIKQHVWVNFRIAGTVKKASEQPSADHLKKAEAQIVKYSALSIADPVLSFLVSLKADKAKLRKIALKLATESKKRESVKFAIVLLGYCGQEEDARILRDLSSHEEFTFYGAVALKNILPAEEAQRQLLSLASRLHGWGKIAILYELDYENPEIRHWALAYGCENQIGLSYLANVCAIKGKLLDELETLAAEDKIPEEDLFDGICNIFRGLLENDPKNDGIYEYPDAKAAAAAFRTLTEQDTPERQAAAADILDALSKIF